MTIASIHNEYAYWLAQASTNQILITAVELAWGAGFRSYMGNHIRTPTLCTFENGAAVTLTPYQFEVSVPERSGSTEATISLEGPIEGPLFDLLEYLRGAQCDFTMELLVRYFLYPQNMGRPLASRPERYTISTVTFTKTKVSLVAAMGRLPRYQAGIPYTVDEYPGLVVIA